MTPDQARQLIQDAGFSVNRVAAMLGITDRGLRMYLAGSRPIPGPVQVCLRNLKAIAA